MKKILIGFCILKSGCSTVSKIKEGQYYAILCHPLISKESCEEEARDVCPNGHKIINVDDHWSLYTGSMTRMYISCNKR